MSFIDGCIEVILVWESVMIVSEDSTKVYRYDKVLCDAVKRLNPHMLYVINDVTTDLLSLA